ncbi:hypothetical protein AMELA_G00229900 [Ameiurus melas]|uniref:Uncharacterized protein n=1 Tax=Ameiurus melas TaxID=219545 RepID=A0A7J5ZYM0_AMEME|nr:hypothetical protein AMELA_G00229900 [Ameiurus melas]
MRPKWSSLASTQLAMFGGGGMLPMTPRTPSPPSNMEVETLCFGGVFLLRGQDNFTASNGRWTGPCTVKSLWLKKISKQHNSRIAEDSCILGSESLQNYDPKSPTSPQVVWKGFKKKGSTFIQKETQASSVCQTLLELQIGSGSHTMVGCSSRTMIQNIHQIQHKNGLLTTKSRSCHGHPSPLT